VVSVLDHDPLYRRITQHSVELSALPVQRRTDLDHNLVDRNLLGRCPHGYPRHLPIQICFLINRRHPRIHSCS
jgi:hypothetical protein